MDQTGEGVLDLIRDDHRAAAALFDRVLVIAAPIERVCVFAELSATLELHARAEDETFYAALRPADLLGVVQDAGLEHDEIREGLEDVRAVDGGHPAWPEMVATLRQQVEMHVGEEEDETFDLARRVLTHDQLNTLAMQMAAAKRRLQGAIRNA